MSETLSTVESVSARDRLHIPVWIKLFAGGIAVILLLSLLTFPGTISIGIHLERAKKAMEGRKYNTAEKELLKVLDKAPHNMEAESNLLIAAFYNQDYPTFSDQIRKVQTVSSNDIGSALYNKISSTLTEAEGYIENDSLRQFKSMWPDPAHIPDPAWLNYLRKNSDDKYAAYEFASALFDRKEYHLSDSLLQHVLLTDKQYIPALMLAASLRREVGDNDGALEFADRVLMVNKESVWGICAKARAMLWQKKDQSALDLTLKAEAINEKDLYVLSTLAMVYHFSGRVGDRDAVFKKAWAITRSAEDSTMVQYAVDVINKKEKFRD